MTSNPAKSVLAAAICAAMVTAAATACSSNGSKLSTGGQKLFTFKYGTQTGSSSTLPLQIADKLGYFAQEGLAIDYINFPQSNATSAALGSGAIDVSARVVSAVIDLNVKGIPTKLIAAVNPVVNDVVVVGKDSSVPVAGTDGATWQDTIKALKGATIADNGPGSPLDEYMQTYFTAAGLSKTDFTGLSGGEGSAGIAALQSGAKALVANPVIAQQAVSSGAGKIVLRMKVEGPSLVSDQAFIGWACTQKFLDAHPEFSDKFRAAVTKAELYLHDPKNLAAVTTLAVDNKELAAGSGAQAALQSIIDDYQIPFTSAQLKNAIDFSAKYGEKVGEMSASTIAISSAVQG